MVVQMPVLKETTRVEMRHELNRLFKTCSGTTLDSAVSEVLNDKDIFLFFSALCPEKFGLSLGKFSYSDGIEVDIVYGLAIPHPLSPPRKIRLFHYEEVGGEKRELRYSEQFPTGSYNVINLDSMPSVERFTFEVNDALRHAEDRWVDLRRIK